MSRSLYSCNHLGSWENEVSDDIVARLRDEIKLINFSNDKKLAPLLSEAAVEIDRLRVVVGVYREIINERAGKINMEPEIIKLENSLETLRQVHSPDRCAGENCTIHNRSDHHMRSWPQHWRGDRGIMERICPHGVGHPDPDSPWPSTSSEWVHGCDGCCLSDSRV